jgi:uncharacterized protein YjbI with pentapeptide repeats
MFDHCIVEALHMHWLKRNLWKVGIAFAATLLLLMAIAGPPVLAAHTAKEIAGIAGPGTDTVQVTPTEDATVTALNKEKLAQEVQQLKSQNEPDPFGWLRTNAATFLSTLIIVIGGLIGLFRWFGDRRDEREKRAEERFQSVVTGLGDEKEGAKIGAAILLRTFLRSGYEQFYSQTFDLAVAHLRLPRTPHLPEDPNAAQPLTTLSRALIVVFKEAFPLARNQNKGHLQSLDASTIRLDDAFLSEADLDQVWMPKAFLRNAELWKTHLNGAYLSEADLRGANLRGANLHGANLRGADLRGADLNRADLSGANLRGANLIEVNLNEANLGGAYLSGDLFYKATDLSFAVLSRANLAGAILKDTNLYRVKGLTDEQLEYCKARGALINEDTTTSSSQSNVSPPTLSQSNDIQAL